MYLQKDLLCYSSSQKKIHRLMPLLILCRHATLGDIIMQINYATLLSGLLLVTSSFASAADVLPLGHHFKEAFYSEVSTQTAKPQFPALYIYDVKAEHFLSKQDAESYLGQLSEQPLWAEVMEQWVKDSSHFSATNPSLKQAVPTFNFTQPYIIFFDNLPEPMLAQFAAMDPNLAARDSLVKSILAQLDNANSYTTY